MGASHATLALVFDFDDTLVPDSTTSLLKEYAINIRKFWGEDVKALVNSGFDPPHAYLKLILDKIGPSKPLGELTNKDLRKFGEKVNRQFFPGVPSLFRDLRSTVAKFPDIQIEFYVISGGLQEIIEGCQLIRKNFSGVYGCHLAGDTEHGPLKYIKRCITFTEKTRFLFEINKGLKSNLTQKNPYLVNQDVPQNKRRIPFNNMIYVGDGLTDIPCFSLLKYWGRFAFWGFQSRQRICQTCPVGIS